MDRAWTKLFVVILLMLAVLAPFAGLAPLMGLLLIAGVGYAAWTVVQTLVTGERDREPDSRS
ncbi:MAG TPA: hypothetical protein V6C78_15265 [Crinalium sp.]|jgi:hypothetical protein